MTTPEEIQNYNFIIKEIETTAKEIEIKKNDIDGRIDSALCERPFLENLKKKLLENHPLWDIVISPDRAANDIVINGIRINLKLTDGKSSDNSVNKPSIFYSITGSNTYPNSSNWNKFFELLNEAKTNNQIKQHRHKPTEYHYLVKNKITGDVLLKPIFDIYKYVINASNDLQINWKCEFQHAMYVTEDADYLKKVRDLLECIQTSVKQKIERTRKFADADLGLLFT
jgi:hypothetical protein